MEKTAWDKQLIDEYRNKIIKLMANETDKEKLNPYNYDLIILDAIEEFQIDGKCFIQSDDFSKKATQDISFLTLFEDFFDDIYSFESKRKLIPEFQVNNISTLEISNDEVLTFIFDFYHQFDEYYSNIFDKIYSSYKDSIIFSKHRSTTFSLLYNHTSFINIENNNSIEEFINGVHEFGHLIADYIKLRYYSLSNYPFFETLPLFAEANALEYLGSLIPEYKEDIYTYKKSTLLTLFNMARMLIYKNNFYAKKHINNKLLAILSIMIKNHEKIKIARKTIDSSVCEEYTYLIPFLVVIELSSITDFELAKHKLNQILEADNIDNYLSFLYDNEINLNEHSSEYIECIRDNKRTIKY